MTSRAAKRIASAVALVSALLGVRLQAEILCVPAEYPTIKSAVGHALDGDTVLVDNGTYLEKNIEVAKKILIQSKNLFGAVIYGSTKIPNSIFIVKAAARIDGFVLKGSAVGIEQRESPDVRWEAENLLLLDCQTGISVNDTEANVGSAKLRRIIVFGSGKSLGIVTNDARLIDVSGCLIADCLWAFQGYNHLSFRVNDAAVLDCGAPLSETTRYRPVPPATSRIETGKNIVIVTSASLRDPKRLNEFRTFLLTCVLPQEARADAPKGDKAAKEAVLALVMAKGQASSEDHKAAAMSYETARAAGERAGSREIVWQALSGAARNAGLEKLPDESSERYRKMVEYLERWIGTVPGGIYEGDFLEDKAPVFEMIIGLLLDRHAHDPRSGHDKEAFWYAEKAKSLSGLFRSAGKGRPRDPGRAAAGEKIAALQLRLQDPDLASGKKEELISLLEKAESDYQAELAKEEWTRGAKDAQASAGTSPLLSPLDYDGVRRRLGGRALLSYVLGEKRSYVFLATEKELRCAVLPPAKEIEAKVDSYLRFLQIAAGREFHGERAGELLYRILLGPIIKDAAVLPRRFIIVPDGRLFYLPFETLVRSGADGGEQGKGPGGSGRERGGTWPDFWTATAEISYASSASQALSGSPWQLGARRPTSLLAIGDSDGIRCDNRSRKLKRFFSPLAHVKGEIKALAGSYPWGRATVLIDKEAGERRVKAELSAGFDIVHVAAHGIIDDNDWWRSALLLRPEPDLGEDGFLTALEIADLDLPAHLVVLSGCGTGAGALVRGEGIKGLSGAFLRAGADSLLVSLWNVDDRATAVFMEKFYGFLAEGDPPARAAARAKVSMILSGQRNPFYWASFVLIGDAGDAP